MKYGLLALALSTALAADAADKNKPADLKGSWKEVRRISATGEPLDFTDTTFYDFLIGNEYTTQRKAGFMYRGTYKVSSAGLDLGMRMFKLPKRSRNRLLLEDDGGTYEFVRYDKAAAMAENSSAAGSSERAYKDETKPGPVNASQLPGKWEVYKRTSSATLPEVDYTRIIRAIDMKREGRKITGSVASTRDMQGKPSWTITRYDDGVLHCSGKDNRRLKVLRCDGDELILQEGAITYFFKQFK